MVDCVIDGEIPPAFTHKPELWDEWDAGRKKLIIATRFAARPMPDISWFFSGASTLDADEDAGKSSKSSKPKAKKQKTSASQQIPIVIGKPHSEEGGVCEQVLEPVAADQYSLQLIVWPVSQIVDRGIYYLKLKNAKGECTAHLDITFYREYFANFNHYNWFDCIVYMFVIDNLLLVVFYS